MEPTPATVPAFNRKRSQPIQWTMDEDTFQAAAACPQDVLLELIKMGNPDTTREQKIAAMPTFLDQVLLPESAARYAARVKDPENPIELEQTVEVAKYLVEQYTGRPTAPPSSSESGGGDTGHGSTPGAPPTGE